MKKWIKDIIDALTELKQSLLASDMPKYAHTVNLVITNLMQESNRLEKLIIPKIAEIEKEALTVQSLRMLNEIYDGCDSAFMDRDTFIDVYLDGIGEYEKKIAKKHDIEIESSLSN